MARMDTPSHPLRRALRRALTAATERASAAAAEARARADAFDADAEIDAPARYHALIAKHLRDVPRKASSVELPDPTAPGGLRAIPLDPALKPDANARRYLKRHQRAVLEREALNDTARRTERDNEQLAHLYALYNEWDAAAPPDWPPTAPLAAAAERLGVHVPGLAGAVRRPDGAGERVAASMRLDERLREIHENNRDSAKDDPPAATENRACPPETGPVPDPAWTAVARFFVSADGWPIYVGRSAADNDRLSLRLCGANDLWLHVAHETGSHVVARTGDRYPSVDAVPSGTRLDAAVLAVHYSKARAAGRARVDCTTGRHVGKSRGAPAGQVTLSRHQTLTVRMDLESARLNRLLAQNT